MERVLNILNANCISFLAQRSRNASIIGQHASIIHPHIIYLSALTDHKGKLCTITFYVLSCLVSYNSAVIHWLT